MMDMNSLFLDTAVILALGGATIYSGLMSWLFYIVGRRIFINMKRRVSQNITHDKGKRK